MYEYSSANPGRLLLPAKNLCEGGLVSLSSTEVRLAASLIPPYSKCSRRCIGFGCAAVCVSHTQ